MLKFVEDEKIPYFLLGNGSNVLASDAGFRGAIIKLEGEFLEVKTDDECISAGTGVTLSKLAKKLMMKNLLIYVPF